MVEYDKLLMFKYGDLRVLEKNGLLIYDDVFDLIDKLSKDEEMPHIIFYGMSGVGKKIVLNKLLELLYGNTVYKLHKNSYEIEQPCGKKKSVDVIESSNHIIINPNKNNADRTMIQTIVKDFTIKIKLCVYENTTKFKVVQIQNMDDLTFNSQTVLRRLIEKKSKTFRFLFWCKSISNISDPIRSRCMMIHIGKKTNEQLKVWIRKICEIENIEISDGMIKSIIKKSEKNMKSILLLLDIYRNKNSLETAYDQYINIILSEICGNYNIKIIREVVYELIRNIPVNKVLTDIFEICLLYVNDIETEKRMIDDNMEFMFNLSKGRREIIHVETYLKYLHTILSEKK